MADKKKDIVYKTDEEIELAFDFAKAEGSSRAILVESYLTGMDHRMLVVNGELVAVAKRVPGHVKGDGKLSIAELIDVVNSDPRRGVGHEKVLTQLKLDDQAQRLLRIAGYTPESILEKDEILYLRDTANLSTGGTAIDMTDQVHPDNREMAVRAITAVGLDVGGVDFLTTEKYPSDKIDLVITWLDVGNYKAFDTSKKIKEAYPNVLIAALSHYSAELRKQLAKENEGTIDYVFHWNGNVEIFLAIIKLAEDSMNAEKDINEVGVKAILLVEDSMRFYSRYLPMIYKIILKQTHAFMSEGLNEHRRMMSMRGRPKILLATNYEEGLSLFEKYKYKLLGVISDVSYPREGVRDVHAGFHLLEYVRSYKRYFPFLIQSSESHNEKRSLELKGKFLYKHSETLGIDLKNYITKYFAFGDFEFWDPDQMKVLATVKDLKSLQKAFVALNKYKSETEKEHSRIFVAVECEKPQQTPVVLRYYIENAGWSPQYDFRVEELNQPLNIVYQANVYQTSGEVWENVHLKLSNGMPSLSTEKPEFEK